MKIWHRIKPALKYLLKNEPQVYLRPQLAFLNPNSRLFGKKIIVTGGSRGLGYSMAKKFVSEGAQVLITGRNKESLEVVANKIGCKYCILDVTKPSEFDEFINEACSLLDGIDCLVNNAGVSLHEKDFFDVTVETFDIQICTNFRGPFFLTQSFLKYLLQNKNKGNILFISSETGNTMDFRPYGFTKGAINSMVKGLAFLLKAKSVRVNAIAPGVTASDMTGINPDSNLYAGRYGAGRFYLPEEIAETACFLLSDNSDCISGEIITCNNANTINARWK